MATVLWPSTLDILVSQHGKIAAPGLTGWWNFDNSSALGQDSSASGHDAAVVGAAYSASGFYYGGAVFDSSLDTMTIYTSV
jgi:hypothetical protein